MPNYIVERCSSRHTATMDAMVLLEDLKDKNIWAGTRGKSRYVYMCERERERDIEGERASSSGRVARAVACRSNAPNLSIKTAVISTTTASNNLMINYWQSPSLLSFSHLLSLCLSQSLSLPSLPFFPKIRHRLQHESCRPVFGSVTSDFAAGAMQHSPPNAHTHAQPLLLWHLPGRHRDPHISTHPPAQPRCWFYPA